MQSNFVLSDKEAVNVNGQAPPVIVPCFVKRFMFFVFHAESLLHMKTLFFVSQSFYSEDKKIENDLLQ